MSEASSIHEFEEGQYPNLCSRCGRERLDREYHRASADPCFDVRVPLVRQGMIDAVQAAGHHAMDQQSLQRILQAALEWQERNGCTCCRVVRAVDKLAHALAYVHTVAALECVTLSDGGWWKISGLEEYEKAGIERDFLYLEMRGLIERHPKKMDWFRVRDESEAAIVVEVAK